MKSPTRKQVGKRIAQVRKQAGFTQAGAAEKLNIANESVSRLERGTQWTDYETLAAMARLYGVTPADLLAAIPAGPGSKQKEAVQKISDLLRDCKLDDLELVQDLLTVLLRHR